MHLVEAPCKLLRHLNHQFSEQCSPVSIKEVFQGATNPVVVDVCHPFMSNAEHLWDEGAYSLMLAVDWLSLDDN